MWLRTFLLHWPGARSSTSAIQQLIDLTVLAA
jgi:hypothetical protein